MNTDMASARPLMEIMEHTELLFLENPCLTDRPIKRKVKMGTKLMIVLPIDEAIRVVNGGKFTSIRGRKPVAIGLLNPREAVLLFRTPDEEYAGVCLANRGCSEYTGFSKEDADPNL